MASEQELAMAQALALQTVAPSRPSLSPLCSVMSAQVATAASGHGGRLRRRGKERQNDRVEDVEEVAG